MASVYEIITDRIINKLEQGVVPWRRPWHAESGLLRNLISGKEYRGINVFLLSCQGYSSPLLADLQASS
ncbi:MAG TPA: ArdC family protein [Myxococcota bacterium]|nr:ArdC family protein [Myxococcota bacterium]